MSTTKKPTTKVKAPAKAPAPTGTAPVAPVQPDVAWVIVGGRGAAGRIMVGSTIYDGVTPQVMQRETFERLKAQYDLREVNKP